MARTARLIGMLGWGALVVASAAWAASPCEESRAQTGIAVAPGDGGVSIAAVDDDSPAKTSGVRVGDAVVQVNGAVPRSCGEWARTMRDARKDGRALLLLVRRGGSDTAVAVPAVAWARVAPAPPPIAPAPAPTVKALVSTPPPKPLPPETHVSVDEVTRGIARLADPAPPRVDAYRQSLTHLEREVETLAARGTAPTPVVAGLRTVLRYYDGAEIAWTAAEEQREAERRPRHVPTHESATATYFSDSRAARVIDEFPFLSATVVREPSEGRVVGESGGLWRPLQARELLWTVGRAELDRLSTWLASGTP